MWRLFAIIVGVLVWCGAKSQPTPDPIYIVNGVEQGAEYVAKIDTADIEQVDTLPADETTIAKYGDRANNGVVVITLKYDTPATFDQDDSFTDYIASQIVWKNHYGVAKVALRYIITEDGSIQVTDKLQVSDKRLLLKVLKAISNAPKWQPAIKNGAPIPTEHVLTITLPKGKELPNDPYVILL